MSGPHRKGDIDEVRREKIAAAFLDFCATIRALRDPETGCPWDLEQDHKSLRRYMIEEAYEAAEVMAGEDAAAICDELGDVLLQVVLNSQVASDAETFAIEDVIAAIDGKMRRRHPHVFGSATERQDNSKETIHSNWLKIKAEETGDAKPAAVFAAAEGRHPALLQAQEIGKISAKANFDWDGVEPVMGQLRSEVAELEEAFAAREQAPAALTEEVGDVFFTLVQVCRHLGIDPEVTAMDANQKFLKRFREVEALAESRGLDVRTAPRQTLEDLWQEAKRRL